MLINMAVYIIYLHMCCLDSVLAIHCSLPKQSCLLYYLKGQLDEVNTITLLHNDGVMKSESSIEDDKVSFILPADREYSTSFSLNTTCGIMSNISSITFSEEFNFTILAHVEFFYTMLFCCHVFSVGDHSVC